MRMRAQDRLRNKPVDYKLPIVADGDTGYSGLSHCMRLTNLLIKSGAAAVHIEDQKAELKKSGHVGGIVLVPTCEQISRLMGLRFQADILQNGLVIIARTDAGAATFLERNSDATDHAFIKGATSPECKESLAAFLRRRRGYIDAEGSKTV